MKWLLLPVLLMALLLGSCECYSRYQFRVVNGSSNTIKIKYLSNSKGYRTDTVAPGGTLEMYSGDGPRCGCSSSSTAPQQHVPDSSLNYISGITVYRQDTVVARINFNKEGRWQFQTANRLGTYTATIKDSDF